LLKRYRVQSYPVTVAMKSLTFFCLSCRRHSLVELLPVVCAYCRSSHGILQRWQPAH
jgi:hypothetical protein